MTLKTLSEHNTDRYASYKINYNSQPEHNGIACDVCGSELFDSNPSMSLTSNPLQKNIHCENCGFTGYRIA